MAALRRLAALVLVTCLPMPASAQGVDAWRSYVVEASSRYGVPTAWIERVMRIESGGQLLLAGRPIVSSAGAMGLMQLMPATWAEMCGLAGLGADPFDPHDNILAGTLYLRLLYDQFGYPGLFAAYNAGPARYSRYLAGRGGLPAETIRYVSMAGGAGVAMRPVRPVRAIADRMAAVRDPLFAIAPRQ